LYTTFITESATLPNTSIYFQTYSSQTPVETPVTLSFNVTEMEQIRKRSDTVSTAHPDLKKEQIGRDNRVDITIRFHAAEYAKFKCISLI
jgi:hypothetical protein